MDPVIQSIVAQAIVLLAGVVLLWRLYRVALGPSHEVRCARCPQPSDAGANRRLPPGARRPDSLRVLNLSPQQAGGGREH